MTATMFLLQTPKFTNEAGETRWTLEMERENILKLQSPLLRGNRRCGSLEGATTSWTVWTRQVRATNTCYNIPELKHSGSHRFYGWRGCGLLVGDDEGRQSMRVFVLLCGLLP